MRGARDRAGCALGLVEELWRVNGWVILGDLGREGPLMDVHREAGAIARRPEALTIDMQST